MAHLTMLYTSWYMMNLASNIYLPSLTFLLTHVGGFEMRAGGCRITPLQSLLLLGCDTCHLGRIKAA